MICATRCSVAFRFRLVCPFVAMAVLAARATWLMVSSFFPPLLPLLLDSCEKQMADGRDQQMSLHRDVFAAFEVVQTQFSLLVLKAAFDVPASEGHLEQLLQRDARRRVGEEILGLASQGVLCHDQPQF